VVGPLAGCLETHAPCWSMPVANIRSRLGAYSYQEMFNIQYITAQCRTGLVDSDPPNPAGSEEIQVAVSPV
jgi:hypothetical protein